MVADARDRFYRLQVHGDTAQSIQTAGHTLEFLPPYSPDLNQIEHTWAETKAERRRTGKSVEEVCKEKIRNQN